MVLSRVMRMRGLLRAAVPVAAAAERQAAVSRLGVLRRQLAVASMARFNGAAGAQTPTAAPIEASSASSAAVSTSASLESPADVADNTPIDLASVGTGSSKVLTIADVLSTRESEVLAQGRQGWFDEWESVSGSETVHDAVALMVERDIGSLIVTEENEGIVGIVTERDVLTKLSPRTAHSAEKLVRDIMSSHIMCIHPSTAVIDALATMTKENIRHLAVLHGELSTIVKKGSVPEEAMRCVLSITDILKAYSRFEAQKKAAQQAQQTQQQVGTSTPVESEAGSSSDAASTSSPDVTAAPANQSATTTVPATSEAEAAPVTTAATLLKKKAKRVNLILNTRAEDNISVADAVDEMSKHNFGAVLVVDKEQRVQGIFTERDYLTKVLFEQKDPTQVRLTDVASTVHSYLQIEDTLEKCWNVAVTEDCRHFPVIGVMRKDREKELAGILSIKDIVREISKGHETTRAFRLMDFFKSKRDSLKQEQVVAAAVTAAATVAPPVSAEAVTSTLSTASSSTATTAATAEAAVATDASASTSETSAPSSSPTPEPDATSTGKKD